MTVEEFEDLLKKHDWNYQYADGENFNKGSRQRAIINAAMRDNPELRKIYDEYNKK